jgi:hypothetical protein
MVSKGGTISIRLSPRTAAAASELEAVLSAPPDKLRLRGISFAWRQQNPTAGIDDRSDAGRIIGLPRNYDVHVVVQSNQTSVEHPMCGAGTGQAVAHNVRPTRFYGADVSGLNFGQPATVDEL